MPTFSTLFAADSIFWALMKNAALLVALAYAHSLLPTAKRRPTVMSQMGMGFLLGLIGITVVTAAYRFHSGTILDTRSVLVCITGLYFGFIPTLMEMLIVSAYRLWQGGAPAPVGVAVIFSSGLVGLAWRHLRKPDLARIGWRELLAFGFTVHGVMMLFFVFYPNKGWQPSALVYFGIPVLGIFPLVTVALGKLLSSRLQRVTDAELLRQSEERFKLIFKGANDGWWDWNLLSNQLTYSPRWWEMLGMEPVERHDNPDLWRQLIHPEDVERVNVRLDRVLEAGERQYEVEFRLRHLNNGYLSVISRGYIERDETGRPIRVSGTNVDITPMRRALDEANVAKSYFESAGRIARIGYWEFSFDGAFVFWSDMTCEIHDIPPGSLVYLEEALSYYPPEYHARLQREIEEAREFGRPYHGEYEIITAKGRRIWVQSRAEPVRSADGHVVGLRGVFQDIDAQVRAAEALRMSERNYREIFNSATDAIFVHDETTGQVLDVNDAMLRMYGFTKAQALGLTPADFGSGEPPYGEEEAREKISIARTEGSHMFVWHSRHATGRLFWVEISLRKAEIGGQGRILASVRDISERKRLEERVSEIEKMESLGRLAGGIAHDFNNMLGVIIGHADLAGYRYTGDDVVQDHLTQIRHAADRSAELVRQLLTFARRQITTPRIIDLNDTIKSTLTMLHRLIGEHISLQWTPAPALWPVRIDPSQMEQILTNLVLNARDAISDYGTISIRAYNAGSEYFARDQDGVVLEVTDTGGGMDQQTLKRAFEPFFTTKSIGQGTGLGLATVYGIVEQNGGSIEVKSEPGAGTTFIVRLPRQIKTTANAHLTKDASEPADTSGCETILVVEDEPAMRILATRALQMKGYNVISTASPAEALEIAGRKELVLDLIVSDIMMPGMSGHALREHILTFRPSLRFLFVSGYSDRIEENLADFPALDFLAKPFSASALAAKARELIDRPVKGDWNLEDALPTLGR